MEMAKIEVVQVERAVTEIAEAQVRELGEFQLALVGGGIGSVIFG